MNRTNIAILILAMLAGGMLVRLAPSSGAANADVTTRALDSALAVIPAAVLAHCEIPCGIFDDNMMVRQMLLDAETIRKASAQIIVLAKETDAAHLNTIARWAMVKEEHSRDLQHMNAWYFLTQRVKAVPADDPGYAAYLDKLAAHHAISVAAMKAAQSLDPAAQDRLVATIKVVEPWYPPKDAGALLPVDDGNWTRIADRVRP